MDIVPGIDTEPGHGQTQAEQFISFKNQPFWHLGWQLARHRQKHAYI